MAAAPDRSTCRQGLTSIARCFSLAIGQPVEVDVKTCLYRAPITHPGGTMRVEPRIRRSVAMDQLMLITARAIGRIETPRLRLSLWSLARGANTGMVQYG